MSVVIPVISQSNNKLGAVFLIGQIVMSLVLASMVKVLQPGSDHVGDASSAVAPAAQNAKHVRRARVSDRGRQRHTAELTLAKHCSGAWSVMGLVRFQRPLQHKAQQW